MGALLLHDFYERNRAHQGNGGLFASYANLNNIVPGQSVRRGLDGAGRGVNRMISSEYLTVACCRGFRGPDNSLCRTLSQLSFKKYSPNSSIWGENPPQLVSMLFIVHKNLPED